MSLLLDALRRAERERHRGPALDLAHMTQPPARESPPRRGRTALVLLVLGGAVLALVLFLGRRPAANPAPVAVAVPAATLPAVVAAPLVRAEPVAQPPPAIAVADVVSLDDVLGAPETPAPVLASAAPVAEMRRTLPPPAGAAPTEDVALAPAATPAAEQPEPEPVPGTDVEEEAAPEAEPAEPPAAKPEGGVVRLRDMPAAYRADFPPLSVDVHVYQRDAAKRFVLINGRRYKEGERLAEGPQIVQIVEHGIVFDYRGERVLYPAAQ